MKTFLAELKRLNIPVTHTSPWKDEEDAAIYLGGEYDGVHLSIGQGYYSVVRPLEDDTIRFITGTWLLEKELKDVMK